MLATLERVATVFAQLPDDTSLEEDHGMVSASRASTPVKGGRVPHGTWHPSHCGIKNRRSAGEETRLAGQYLCTPWTSASGELVSSS